MRFWRRKKKDQAEVSEPESSSTETGGPLLKALIRAELESRKNRTPQPLLEMEEWKAIEDAPAPVQVEVVVECVRHRDDENEYYTKQVYTDVLGRLLRRSLPFEEPDLSELIEYVSVFTWSRPIGLVLRATQRYLKNRELTDTLRAALKVLGAMIQESQYISAGDRTKMSARVAEALGASKDETFHVDETEPFGARVVADLSQFGDEDAAAMRRVLAHAATADAGRPTKRWIKEAQSRLEALDGQLFNAAATVWLDCFDVPRSEVPTRWPQSEWQVADINAVLLKGLIWCAPSSHPDADLIRAIGRTGISAQRKIPSLGPRCTKVTNAAAYALGAIEDPLALAQLAILRSRVKNRTAQKQMAKALHAAANRLGVPEEEVEEMAVPTFGLTDVGRLDEKLGDFSAELRSVDSSTVTLSWRKADGKLQKTIPKAVKEDHAGDLKELKAAVKDIQKFLPTQRERLDGLYGSMKSWNLDVWRDRYLDHPIVGIIARRLIWNFASGDESTAAVFSNDQLLDVEGSPIDPPADSTVTLWHPIDSPADIVLAWRTRLAELDITQPFKQAHREIYVLTDAERTTRVYSNRYAAHILKQHQFHALCGARGWRNQLRLLVDDEYPPASRLLPAYGLRAEYWIEGAGEEFGRDTNDAGTFHYLVTDQVRFYREDASQVRGHAGGGGYGVGWDGGEAPEPLPLEEIPAIVFSEVMRDVDLFVGVASVGNDPAWMDGGEAVHHDYWRSYAFGELSTSAQVRREVLEGLIPRLKIADRCSFDDRFLVVRGKVRTYKIHLGSGNIMMEPNDQYLCIVPKAATVTAAKKKVFLPFEGDRTLSIILSKALLLAADDKISDTSILSQIRGA